MRIKITKNVPISYFPPVGSIHEVQADRWTRDGAAYPIRYQGESVMVLGDECEVLDDEICEACQIWQKEAGLGEEENSGETERC